MPTTTANAALTGYSSLSNLNLGGPAPHAFTTTSPLARQWQQLRRSLHLSGRDQVKRALDVSLAGLALLMLAPLFLGVALAIWLHDRGPVLFWQRRVGLNGKVFAFPKFRSMCVNAEALRAQIAAANQHGSSGVTFKMKRDPRITPIGRLIRRTSIDELPQLWCVLTGDMSLVGPRPALESEVARYTPYDRQRLAAVPGLTCIWQVSGRSDVPFPQQVEMDLEYIHTRSLRTDISLLLRTVPAVVLGRGAY